MQSNAAMVSLVTQGQVPATLATLPTSSVFSHKYSSSVRSASLDSYYALNTQPAVSAEATCTFDVQYGDYISNISLVCTLPAIVNVTTAKVDIDGNPGGADPNYRAIVPQAADMHANGWLATTHLIRQHDNHDIGVISQGTQADNLAADLNTAHDHAAHFCDYVGARLLKSVDLLVNGKKTQCFTGSWLFVFNELYRTSAGKSAAGLGAADPTVTSAVSRLSDKNRAKKVESLRGSELEIELPFFFSQASESQGGSGGGGSPFPRFQFSRHDALQVRFHFHSLKSLVANSAGLGGEVLSIVADRSSAVTIPVQTVTVADKPGESSSVASYLQALSSAPKRDDFRASDFVLGVRVRETYVDPVTLSSQRVAPYRAAVAQPHTCEATAVKAGTDVTLDAMKYVNLPVHSIYVVPRMLENTVMNRWFSTEGPVDALTGCPQPCISKLAIHLGSTVYNHDTSSSVTIHAKQNAAKFATSVATHHAIFQHNFSQTNPFALHSASSSSSSSSSSSQSQGNAPSCVPNGCVMLSAVKGSRVVVTPNLAAFRNHSAAGGSNYSVGRGSATGNEIAFVCHTLHFNTISIVPDRTNRTEPVVQLGVEDTNRLPETITAN
jgi:hypothetical protein